MKVYILTLDYTYRGDIISDENRIVGVYSDVEKAIEAFKKVKEEQKALDMRSGYDKTEETSNTYVSWKDGFYDEDHTNLQLIKQQVKS